MEKFWERKEQKVQGPVLEKDKNYRTDNRIVRFCKSDLGNLLLLPDALACGLAPLPDRR